MKSALYLKEIINELQVKNPSLTLSELAKSLGLSSHSYLSRVLGGTQAPSKLLITKFKKIRKIDQFQFQKLLILRELDRSKTEAERSRISEDLNSLAPKRHIQTSKISFLEDPLFPLLLEMSQLKDFKFDLQWMFERTKGQFLKGHLKRVMSGILKKGYLIQEGGILRKPLKRLKSSDQLSSRQVRKYHKNILAMAQEALEVGGSQEREFQAYTFVMDQRKMEQAKKKIRSFCEEFIDEFEGEGDSNEVYQLGTQLFAMTQKKGERDV